MKKGLMSIVLLILFVGPVTVRADEVTQLKQQLDEQQKMLMQMQQKLEQLEAGQKTQEKKIDEKISTAVQDKQFSLLPDNLKWVENVKLSGDLRYRHETVNSQSNGRWNAGDNKNRIRARLQLDAKINDDWNAIFRIASGSADPTSTNQTLENAFSSKAIWLDLAYFDWHPASVKGLNVYGGKMKNPFYRVGGSQLVWDDDLNPEGIAASYEKSLSETNKLYVNGGGFWVDQSSSTGNISLWGAQGYLKHTFENKNYLTAGMSYYNYGNLKGKQSLYKQWSSSTPVKSLGNSINSSTFNYQNDYDIVEAFSEYGFKFNDMPVAVFGDYVKNIAATSSADTGWLIGFSLNKAKDPGSWEFSYDYRSLDADAVLGQFSDSDFAGGGTDAKGHRFGIKYQIAKNLQAGLTYFMDQLGAGEKDSKYTRLQADLVLKF
ncbi:MAG: putative porin [Phycisphaerae bacterium]